MYTAQENATLRRIIIHLACSNNNSSEGEVFFMLHVAPNGNQVVDLLQNSAEVTNEEMPYEYIAGGVITNGNMLTIDTKGMRKLRQGDQIVLSWIEGDTSTSSDDFRWYADIFLSQ
jgi:cyclophilin family peptidyl-prolyl cis-trans isomerase